MEKLNGAQWIAKILKDYEVTHVFYVLAILRQGLAYIEDAGIERITAHSEKAAVYMADGYARISHKPGVAMAQSVGAANLAAALQDPFLAHSPVITITGRKPFLNQYRNAYQEIYHAPMYEPVTKYNVNIDTGKQLPVLMRQAFREAVSGAPRPVHLDLLGYAGEVIEAEEIDEEPIAEKRFVKTPSIRIVPDKDDIAIALKLLEESKSPVCVLGSGAATSGAGEAVYALSRKLMIPVSFSCNAKGLVPDTYELTAGSVGTYSCASANQIVSQADLVIFIGSGTGDQVTMNWTIPSDKANIIQIDIEPNELGRNYRNTHGILADARMGVEAILDGSDTIEPKSVWAEECKAIIKGWKESLRDLRESDDIPIRPERLCKTIGDVLPDNAILVADTGYSAVWACSMIELRNMQQTFIRAAGSLGWAFPASLGAKCAAPERPVVCFTGDGGFLYHMAELETARRRKIHTVTVVNNNNAFGQSTKGIDQAYSQKKGKTDGRKEDLYTFESVNYAKLAESLGCVGIRVERPEDIGPAIEKGLSADRPVVVEVLSDRNCHPPMAWKP